MWLTVYRGVAEGSVVAALTVSQELAGASGPAARLRPAAPVAPVAPVTQAAEPTLAQGG